MSCSGCCEFARPHRARLLAAVAAMLVYGAASAGACGPDPADLRQVLPNRENLVPIAAAILIVYLIKGVGAYLSGT